MVFRPPTAKSGSRDLFGASGTVRVYNVDAGFIGVTCGKRFIGVNTAAGCSLEAGAGGICIILLPGGACAMFCLCFSVSRLTNFGKTCLHNFAPRGCVRNVFDFVQVVSDAEQPKMRLHNSASRGPCAMFLLRHWYFDSSDF